MPLLQARKLTKFFGGLAAVNELDLDVQSGEILGLIGPNGAGKTTVFNMIAGVYPPTQGTIRYKGQDITGDKPNLVARKGIARTFQLISLFDSRTVLENMLVAFHLESGTSFWNSVFPSSSILTRERNILQKAGELLDFVGLKSEIEGKLAKNLPHGHRKALGLAMALATDPELLLLDEPAGGLNADETESMMSLIKKLGQKGMSVLLVEHNLKVVMGVCERIVVLNFGRKIAEGLARDIRENKDVIEAYLGVETGAANY